MEYVYLLWYTISYVLRISLKIIREIVPNSIMLSIMVNCVRNTDFLSVSYRQSQARNTQRWSIKIETVARDNAIYMVKQFSYIQVWH